MTMIKLTVGENVYQRKFTMEDIITVYEFYQKYTEAKYMVEQIKVNIGLAVHLFGNQGLTEEEIMKSSGDDFKQFMDNVQDIVELALDSSLEDEGSEEDKNSEEEKK